MNHETSIFAEMEKMKDEEKTKKKTLQNTLSILWKSIILSIAYGIGSTLGWSTVISNLES